jgi:hypothetical protein
MRTLNILLLLTIFAAVSVNAGFFLHSDASDSKHNNLPNSLKDVLSV